MLFLICHGFLTLPRQRRTEYSIQWKTITVIPNPLWSALLFVTGRLFVLDFVCIKMQFEKVFDRYNLDLADPVLTDPYIRCLVPTDIQIDVDLDLQKHCLATKFIDDKLLSTIDKIDGLRQVVLLTDGMDTRPYRINWPPSTIIFDVSPDITFRRSTQNLQDVGAKIQRSCLLLHVPSETSDIEQVLCSKGYNGARPSFWVYQGLPLQTLGHFKDILRLVSNLAMKGSLFVGELPSSFFETDKRTKMEWMDKIFTSHGLKVKMIEYDEVARNLGKQESTPHCQENVLFVAEQLQFSDVQMEIWRREFERIEEGDEEGFEEL